MDYTLGEEHDGCATYTLSFRNKGADFFVVDGIREMLHKFFRYPISNDEIAFARDHFAAEWKKWGVGVFNSARWEEVVVQHDGIPPLTIRAVPDGTILKPGEPVLTVSGPKEIAARFEPRLLSIFYPSSVATHAHMLEKLGTNWRIVDFSNRSSINYDMAFSGIRSLYIGMGLEKTSNDAATAVYDRLKTSGTLAHRYFASFDTEDEWFRTAIQKHETVVLLCDYVESMSGLEKIIALKKEYKQVDPSKNIYPRFDSGNILQQVQYYLRRLKEEWLYNLNEKLVISEVGSLEQLYHIETTLREDDLYPEYHVLYGIGGLLLATRKTRDELSAAYKQTSFNNLPTWKLSNDPVKSPIPGNPTVVITPDNKRVIAQLEEVLSGDVIWNDLMEVVYNSRGIVWYIHNDFDEIHRARQRVLETDKYLWLESRFSPLCEQYKDEVYRTLISQKFTLTEL